MLALFRVFRMLSQPSHCGAPAIEVPVLGIDFHAAEFRLVIEPFAAETYSLYHVLIVTHYRQSSTTKASAHLWLSRLFPTIDFFKIVIGKDVVPYPRRYQVANSI
jgi:hypothetical protein